MWTLRGQIHSSVVFLDLCQVYWRDNMFLACPPAISPDTFENKCQGSNSDWPHFKHLCFFPTILIDLQIFSIYFLNETENNADQIQNYCCLDMLIFCLCEGLKWKTHRTRASRERHAARDSCASDARQIKTHRTRKLASVKRKIVDLSNKHQRIFAASVIQ